MKYEISGALLKINLTAPIQADVIVEIANKLKELDDNKPKFSAISFSGLTNVDDAAIRLLVQLAQTLRKSEVAFCGYGPSPVVTLELKNRGVDTLFKFKKTEAEALESAGIKKSKKVLDANFVGAFIKATINTFKIQMNCEITSGKPFVKQSPIEFNVAGVIALVSDAFSGNVSICFSEPVIMGVYESLLGEKPAQLTKEVQECAGEVLNIVFGQAKQDLNDLSGYKIQKAIPSIVKGQNMTLTHPSSATALVIPFECKFGKFHLEVAISDSLLTF